MAAAASGPRGLGVCLEKDGNADAGWARGGEARAAREAASRLRLFRSGLANSSWSRVAPRGRAAPRAGEWRALLRLRAAEDARLRSALLAVRVEPGGAAAEEAAPPWALGLGAAGLLALAALAWGLQLSTLALVPAEVQGLRESGAEAQRAGCALGALLLLASLTQAVLLYRAAGQHAVPAELGSAGLVFLVGEVVPAAVSGRWALALALALAPRALLLSRLAVLLTLPVALPVGQLLELAARPGRLPERGVPCCRTVEDVLTPLEDCFMLDAGASGHTRIPVYEGERSNIVDMLHLKDLAFVDPEDCTPLSTITRFYNHPLHFVFNAPKLDAKVNEGEGDPFYEVLGLVTLEDVIEEIIQPEILDEPEDYRDATVRKKPAPLSAPLRRKEEFSSFKVFDDEYKVKISPQLLLATQRFLSREMDVFSPLRISQKEVRFDESNRLAAHNYLYQRSQPVDYFILILQGRVEVEIGKEGLKFENGAFTTHYGVFTLSGPSSVHQSPVSSLQSVHHDLQPEPADGACLSAYCPDYTVRALSDLQFIKVTLLQYLHALAPCREPNVGVDPGSPGSGPGLKAALSRQATRAARSISFLGTTTFNFLSIFFLKFTCP
ncbi:unnamed protein product [Nyctereutes procyonoides]|uniref:Metal transporter n=1 Tax=Nyctereutes procyonoides TaxID=34880 RepID=A0A811ZS75_NYCPR|nr:unnamed protein product [Nyctereutes procyonoides]